MGVAAVFSDDVTAVFGVDGAAGEGVGMEVLAGSSLEMAAEAASKSHIFLKLFRTPG